MMDNSSVEIMKFTNQIAILSGHLGNPTGENHGIYDGENDESRWMEIQHVLPSGYD